MKSKRVLFFLLALTGISGLVIFVVYSLPVSNLKHRNADLSGSEFQLDSRASDENAGEGKVVTFAGDSAGLRPEYEEGFYRIRRQWDVLCERLDDNYQVTEEHRELARATVDQLGLGPELMTLLDFFDSVGYLSSGSAISSAVIEILKPPGAGKERRDLAGLVNDSSSNSFLNEWAFEAGRYCPEKELGRFAAEIRDERMARNVIFGFAVGFSETDPEKAVSLVIENLGDSPRSSFLKYLFDKVPEGTDFESLFSLLSDSESSPAEDSTGRKQIMTLRSALVNAWFEKAPFEAIDYVLAKRVEYGPEKTGRMWYKFARADVKAAIEMVQDLEPGPFFDSAVHEVTKVAVHKYEAETRELASQISDKNLREETLRLLTAKRNPPTNKLAGE